MRDAAERRKGEHRDVRPSWLGEALESTQLRVKEQQ